MEGGMDQNREVSKLDVTQLKPVDNLRSLKLDEFLEWVYKNEY